MTARAAECHMGYAVALFLPWNFHWYSLSFYLLSLLLGERFVDINAKVAMKLKCLISGQLLCLVDSHWEKLNHRETHKSQGPGNRRGQANLLHCNPPFIHQNSQERFAERKPHKLKSMCHKASLLGCERVCSSSRPPPLPAWEWIRCRVGLVWCTDSLPGWMRTQTASKTRPPGNTD